MNEHLLERHISGEVVYSGKLLQVRRDKVGLPDGSEAVREFINHPGAVVILALLDNGKLLFERQYRYPVSQVVLELPAGKIDAGEDPLVTARRELLEETGHAADDWNYLGLMHPGVGYSNEHIDIYLARKVRRVGPAQLDVGEFIELFELTPDEARNAVLQGEITDVKTITALYWLQNLGS